MLLRIIAMFVLPLALAEQFGGLPTTDASNRGGLALTGVSEAIQQFDTFVKSPDALAHEMGAARRLHFTSTITFFAKEVVSIALGQAGEELSGVLLPEDVPFNLAELSQDSLDAVDAIVAQNIKDAFTKEKQDLMDSVVQKAAGYTDRNDLLGNRAQVFDLSADVLDLLAFFDDNGVASNQAYQTLLAMQLSLLKEILNLDILLEESNATIQSSQNNLRRQARQGKDLLLEWRNSYNPTQSTTKGEVRNNAQCNAGGGCGVSGCQKKPCVNFEKKVVVELCTVVGSKGLEFVDQVCETHTCNSKHAFKSERRKRNRNCRDNFFTGAARTRLNNTIGKELVPEFRDLNVEAVFGDGFEDFIASLEEFEVTDFTAAA